MTTQLPAAAAAFVQSINGRDPAAFEALFADGAVVDDAGRQFHGRDAIRAWGDHDIFAPLVTLEVLHVADRDGETVLTTRVDGNFDRTGLPDPVIINQHITAENDKIVALTCRLADQPSGT